MFVWCLVMFRDVRMTLACRAASLESPVDFPTSWKRTPTTEHWITLQAVGEPSRFTHKQHGVQVPVPVRDRVQATITIKKGNSYVHYCGTEQCLDSVL